MEKLKQYKYIIFIILIILGFSFYWFQVRPSNIKSDCSDRYLNSKGKGLSSLSKPFSENDFENYQARLHRSGI